MSMNIKDEEVHRLTKELAGLTGESLTTAVAVAVQERLQRVRDDQHPSLAERLMAIAKECGPLFKEPWRSMEHGDILYDEMGLPK